MLAALDEDNSGEQVSVFSLAAKATSSSVTLRWEHYQGADGYYLWQDNSDSRIFCQDTNYTFADLRPTTTYKFNICAVTKGANGAETLSKSESLNVRTPPLAPQPTVSNITGNSIKISWQPVEGAEGYQVLILKNGKWNCAFLSSERTSYTFKRLNSLTPYKVTVKAYVTQDGKKYVSDRTILTALTGPEKPPVKVSKVTGSSISIEWDKVSGAAGYQVLILKNGKWNCAFLSSERTSYTFKRLNALTEYKVTVKAYTLQNGKKIVSDRTILTATPPLLTPNVKVDFVKGNSITIRWDKVEGAEGYQVLILKNGKWNCAFIAANRTSYTFKSLSQRTSYKVTVKAYVTQNGKKRVSGRTILTATTDVQYRLYTIPSSTAAYTTKKAYYTTLSGGSWYSGYYNPSYPGYITINYMSYELLVPTSNVRVRSNAVMLGTGAIGQYGGKIAGYSACGPTSVAILLNAERNAGYDKDDLIVYAENNRLNDQGSLRSSGGMTAPKMLQLISGYSGGKYSAKNIYSSSVSPSTKLKEQIDSGKRAIVVVQYTNKIVTHRYSGTHFVVITGYEYIDGVLYFYYADPYYGNGGRSLYRVTASTLNTSMNIVNIEPRTLIVLD